MYDRAVFEFIRNFVGAGSFQGVPTQAYWGVGTATTDFPDSPGLGYTKELVREFIAPIRTDLDAFTDDDPMSEDG